MTHALGTSFHMTYSLFPFLYLFCSGSDLFTKIAHTHLHKMCLVLVDLKILYYKTSDAYILKYKVNVVAISESLGT
jgi:hypothetical protein